MKKTAIKITWLIGMVFVFSLFQLIAAGESIKTDYNPGDSYVCRVGESLILDFPETASYQVDTANNPNWKLIKELNYIWLIPNKPNDVLFLTVTNYNGDKIITHITSKSKEELPENPIKRLVIKQFPHKETPQYATELNTTKIEKETELTPAVDPQLLIAEKQKQDEEIKKQKIAASEKLWEEMQKQQKDKLAKQKEEERLAAEAQELKKAELLQAQRQAEEKRKSDLLKEEARLKQEEADRLQKAEFQKQQEEDRLAKEAQEIKNAELIAQAQQQEKEKKEADKIAIKETVKSEKPVEKAASAQQKTEEMNTEKIEPEISNKKKNTNLLIDISGGSSKINKESRTSFSGEIVAAKKSLAGIIAQFALSANVNNINKRYGQSIGIGIEKDKMGIGFFTFLDSLILKTDQSKSSFHYQIRPGIRFKNNRFAISGFAAIAMSKDQYTGIDDPEDPTLGIFDTALNHYGVNIEGILIPRKLFFQLEGAFAESKAYRLLLGIEYGITKHIGIYLKGIKTSYGDQQLLVNELYGNDFSIQAGLKLESNRASLNKQNQIIFPRDYPLVASVKKNNNKKIDDKLAIVLTANPKSGKSPLNVMFTAVLSGGQPPYQLNWFYGAQSQNSADNITTYTYSQKGTYNAYVTVTDGLNQKAISNTEVITVIDEPAATTHTIQASAGAGGTINPSGAVTVADGGNQSFRITANSGYKISNVKVDGASITAAEGKTVYDYEFKNVTYDRTITAQFELQAATTHIIQASAGAGGTIDPSGTVTVADGGNQSFRITANSGYRITTVKVDGANITAAEGQTVYDYPFTNVKVNHEITATFNIVVLTYTVTVTAGANGSITPGTSTYSAGANASFSIQPSSANYKVAQILLDGVNVPITNDAGQTVPLNNIQANHTLSATFSTRTYTVTVTAGANGSITPGTTTFNAGANASFLIQPSSTNYKITQILLDGAAIGISNEAGQTVAINNIQANHTLSATFTRITVRIAIEYRYTSLNIPGCQQVIDFFDYITVNKGDNWTLNVPQQVNVYYDECKQYETSYLYQIFIDKIWIDNQSQITFTNIQTGKWIYLVYGLEIPPPIK